LIKNSNRIFITEPRHVRNITNNKVWKGHYWIYWGPIAYFIPYLHIPIVYCIVCTYIKIHLSIILCCFLSLCLGSFHFHWLWNGTRKVSLLFLHRNYGLWFLNFLWPIPSHLSVRVRVFYVLLDCP
jgi:hypothetical protein